MHIKKNRGMTPLIGNVLLISLIVVACVFIWALVSNLINIGDNSIKVSECMHLNLDDKEGYVNCMFERTNNMKYSLETLGVIVNPSELSYSCDENSAIKYALLGKDVFDFFIDENSYTFSDIVLNDTGFSFIHNGVEKNLGIEESYNVTEDKSIKIIQMYNDENNGLALVFIVLDLNCGTDNGLSFIEPKESNICEAPISEGLVANYCFNENAEDSSGYSNNGDIIGVLPFSQTHGNYYADFNAESYINIKDSSSLNFDNFTFSYWINPKGLSQTDNSYGLPSNYYWLFGDKQTVIGREEFFLADHHGSRGIPAFRGDFSVFIQSKGDGFGTGAHFGKTMSNSYLDSVGYLSSLGWHQVSVVKSSDNLFFYIDGVLDSQQSSFLGYLDNGQNITLGAMFSEGNYGSFLNAGLDNLMMFNRSLEDYEILKIYNSQINDFRYSCYRDYNYCDNSYTQRNPSKYCEFDVCTNGFNGTYSTPLPYNLTLYVPFDYSDYGNYHDYAGDKYVYSNKGYSGETLSEGFESDGYQNYAQVDNIQFDSNNKFSLSFWFKYDSGQNNKNLISVFYQEGYNFEDKKRIINLDIDSENKLFFNISGLVIDEELLITSRKNLFATSSQQIESETWNHVFLTSSPGESAKLYINGVLSAQSDIQPGNFLYERVNIENKVGSIIGNYLSLYPSYFNINIAGYYGGEENIAANFKELALYNRALSSKEVYDTYSISKGERAGFCKDSDMAYYRNDGSISTIIKGNLISSRVYFQDGLFKSILNNYDDFCIGSELNEYSCSLGESVLTKIPCPNGCSNGVCVHPESICIDGLCHNSLCNSWGTQDNIFSVSSLRSSTNMDYYSEYIIYGNCSSQSSKNTISCDRFTEYDDYDSFGIMTLNQQNCPSGYFCNLGKCVNAIRGNVNLLGDVNNDGVVNNNDVTSLQNALNQNPRVYNTKSDIDGDNAIDDYDLFRLRAYLSSGLSLSNVGMKVRVMNFTPNETINNYNEYRENGRILELKSDGSTRKWKVEYAKKGASRGICTPPVMNIKFPSGDLFYNYLSDGVTKKLGYAKLKFTPFCNALQVSEVDNLLREYFIYSMFRNMSVPTLEVVDFINLTFNISDSRFNTNISKQYLLLQRPSEKDDQLPFKKQFGFDIVYEDGENIYCEYSSGDRFSIMSFINLTDNSLINIDLDINASLRYYILSGLVSLNDHSPCHNEVYGFNASLNKGKIVPYDMDLSFNCYSFSLEDYELTSLLFALPTDKREMYSKSYYQIVREIYDNPQSLNNMLLIIDKYPFIENKIKFKNTIKATFIAKALYYSSSDFASYLDQTHVPFSNKDYYLNEAEIILGKYDLDNYPTICSSNYDDRVIYELRNLVL